jgi:hypothetical protein
MTVRVVSAAQSPLSHPHFYDAYIDVDDGTDNANNDDHTDNADNDADESNTAVVVVAERDIPGLYMAIWHHKVREELPL